MALTPQTAVDELTGQGSLQGLDVTEDEALRLLNEADTDMAVRSGWSRARRSIGPSVAGQGDYALSDSIAHPLKVWVAGQQYEPSDEDTAGDVDNLEVYLRKPIFFLSEATTTTGAGAKQLSIRPIPQEDGLTIVASCVVYPTEFAIDGSFNVPPDFRRGLLNYVRYVALDGAEDDTDAALYSSAYEAEVQRLERHRIKRTGHGPVSMRIRGVTA